MKSEASRTQKQIRLSRQVLATFAVRVVLKK
jgi:hypothetical protein